MTTSTTPLADGFEPATRADWLNLVAKTLKGAGAETLIGRTADGLAVPPLFALDDASPPLPVAAAPRTGDRGWDVRAVTAAPTATQANAEALDALAGGAASLLIRLDTGDGAGGVAVSSADDLARALDKVLIDVSPIALDAGFLGPVAAGWLDDVAKAAPAAPLALHLDPLTAFARAGASPGPIAAHVTTAAIAAARLAETYPKASLFLATGSAAHEAGGSSAWELAMAAAAAVAYAKALSAAGLGLEAAFRSIVLGVALDAEPLTSIAKLRALRVIWARITQACGVSHPARIEARTSGRMLTRADRWTNLVRLTSAGFSGAVGGADALVLGTYSDAIGLPDALGLRMARNTQLILMEEAHLGRVADPAAGSWALETMTDDLARAAWAAFQSIETAGGLATALEAGLIAEAVATGRNTLKAALSDRSLRLIGVTDFASGEPAPSAADAGAGLPAKIPDARLPGADSACPALSPIRLEDLAQ